MSTLHEDLRRLADSTGSGFPYVSVYDLRGALAAHPEPEGVGTGAGEDAPRQDTASARVTRSADCPEAPAQAHPLADVEAILALFPMSHDGTGHIADCGYSDESPSCGCYSLPGRLSDWLAAHDAQVRREAKAEALREAARDLPIWEAGNEVIAYQWLRDRAARIARAEGER